ncbi:MAG: ROK family protein [Terriglobales bacterium]
MNATASRSKETPLALGVDIGGTAIKAAVVNVNGDLLERFQVPSPRNAASLRDFVHSALKQAKGPLRGIGIGCKGIIDSESSRVDRLPGDLHFLQGTVLRELVGGNLPVRADNDARAALVAEVLWGAARGRRNVVLLTLGTGVGGAAMVDGVILHGAAGIAGHFGHMTIDLQGGLCMCGNHGCLETRFSSRAIEADYFAHMHRAAATMLSLGSEGQPPSTEAILQAAVKGDESARCVLDHALEYLSAAVVSLLHIFDPEVLVVGGNIATAGEQLLAPLRSAVAQHTPRMLGREVPIVLQTAGGYGGVLGAAGLIFLQQELLKV